MSFQQKMYAIFWMSMAIIGAAIILALLNGRKVEGISYWLFFAALPLFTMGMPALFNQHIFNRDPQRSESSQDNKENEETDEKNCQS